MQTQLLSCAFVKSSAKVPVDRWHAAIVMAIQGEARVNTERQQVTLSPMQGDILQIGDTEEHLLPSGRKTSLSVTILTPRGAQNVREATATWFIWGLPFSQKITLGN